MSVKMCVRILTFNLAVFRCHGGFSLIRNSSDRLEPFGNKKFWKALARALTRSRSAKERLKFEIVEGRMHAPLDDSAAELDPASTHRIERRGKG